MLKLSLDCGKSSPHGWLVYACDKLNLFLDLYESKLHQFLSSATAFEVAAPKQTYLLLRFEVWNSWEVFLEFIFAQKNKEFSSFPPLNSCKTGVGRQETETKKKKSVCWREKNS